VNASASEPRAGFSSESSEGMTARRLFIAGWAIALLYFPSGLLHTWLGHGVYFRDALLLGHLGISLVWLWRTNRLGPFLRKNWLILGPAFFLAPALFDAGARIETGAFFKWSALWLDGLILGRLFALLRGFPWSAQILSVVTALLLLADFSAGVYELRTNRHLLPMSGQVSAFGVKMTTHGTLAKRLRIKGLQRDVFSFANLMAMSAVAGLAFFLCAEAPAARVFGLGWSALFAWMLFVSGGRSAFFGVFAAALFAGGTFVMRELMHRFQGRIVLAWLAVALLISVTGVSQVAESVSTTFLSQTHIGNAGSAHARDANWNGIFDAIQHLPVVLFSGAPLAAIVDAKIAPFYHWADNQYLWFLYHTGVAGFLAVVLFFRNALRRPSAPGKTWARETLLLFLLFVMGEGIARESLTFLGCLPLFVACGYGNTSEGETVAGHGRTSRRSRRAEHSATVTMPDAAREPWSDKE